MTASEIQRLLSERHLDDVFIPECTIGPVSLRMDAWMMKRSWAKPSFVGYEIKVSRSDFLKDDKWPGYLPFCTQFYFVCPWGMIAPEEVGERAGLMYVTKNNTRLMIKKKAPVLKDDSVQREMLMAAVLMSRVKIVKSTFGRKPEQSDEEYWQAWLDSKWQRDTLGKSVSKKLQAVLDKKVIKVQQENYKLREQNDALEEVKKFLAEHDIPLTSYSTVRTLEKRLFRQFKSVRFVVDRGIIALEAVRDALDKEMEKGNE